jgi:SnoaL-like domain
MNARTREQRLQRLEAIHQIENLMGRYACFHLANLHAECLKLSALETTGVRADLPFGIYEGRTGLERLYLGFFGVSDRATEGKMHAHTMTTRVIEVAEDLQTARGTWMSPGHATDKFQGTTFRASWRWVKYGCDFIRENDEWKIWHLHVYGIFATPYDKSWVESAAATAGRGGPPPMPAEFAPDRPSGRFWQYREDAIIPNEPGTPEPYGTFDATMAY